jgi:preprotein translocase subunit SecA
MRSDGGCWKVKTLRDRVIEYAERTMDDIVEAYVNPDLPPEEWDLESMVNKVKEFVNLLQDLEPEHLDDMFMPEIKAFCVKKYAASMKSRSQRLIQSNRV